MTKAESRRRDSAWIRVSETFSEALFDSAILFLPCDDIFSAGFRLPVLPDFSNDRTENQYFIRNITHIQQKIKKKRNKIST
jgi:hypothetical protein